MKFRGIAFISVHVNLEETTLPRDAKRRLLAARAAMHDKITSMYGTPPQQITSVTCVDQFEESDGTNGPRVTLTETIASEASTLDGAKVVK